MKPIYVVLLLLSGVVLLGTASSGAEDQPPSFEPVQVIGNTRITLLAFSRVTAFPNSGNRNGDTSTTPGVVVDYLVEQIGEGDFATPTYGGVTLYTSGKRLAEAPGIVAGGASSLYPYSTQTEDQGFVPPPVVSEDRAKLRREYLRGISVGSQQIQMRIKVGFGGSNDFVFDNVPTRD